MDKRISKLLGGADLASLRMRLRRRYAQAQIEGVITDFRINGLNPHEYETLAQLQGMPARHAASILISIHAIDTALRAAGIATSLKDALEKLDGPIVHIPTARDLTAGQWSRAVARSLHETLSSVLSTSAGLALLKRLSKQRPELAEELILNADKVLVRLPASGLPRSVLAAQSLADPHALDKGRPVATLILAALRSVSESMLTNTELSQPQDESMRAIWAKSGVLVNELARPALFLNLPTIQRGVVGEVPGEPNYLSLRSLLRSPPRIDVAGRDVFICENPNLLAMMANNLGKNCAPMVCTDGMPSAAQQVLLSQLAKSGARLHYHGDFDWPGIRIANNVIQTYEAKPWRFNASDYITAIGAGTPARHKLKGSEAEARWDAALTVAMRKYRLLVSEEDVISNLLQDLFDLDRKCDKVTLK